MSTTASGSNNAVMPATSPAFSLSTNNRSKSWGSLAGSLVVKSFVGKLLTGTLRQLVGCSTFTEIYRRPAPGVKQRGCPDNSRVSHSIAFCAIEWARQTVCDTEFSKSPSSTDVIFILLACDGAPGSRGPLVFRRQT